MSCLTCQWWRPQPLDTWKPKFPGDVFAYWEMLGAMHPSGGRYDWRKYPGDCHLAPQPLPTLGGYLCSSYACVVRPDSLSGMIVRQQDRQREYAEIQEQLMAARKLAKSRFRLLKQRRQATAEEVPMVANKKT